MLVDATVGISMFFFIDGFSSYNQIKMDWLDTWKTIFGTPMGNFHYTAKLFDLKNAGAT